eukprot:3402062-Pyramimonas_sp.AAC.2
MSLRVHFAGHPCAKDGKEVMQHPRDPPPLFLTRVRHPSIAGRRRKGARSVCTSEDSRRKLLTGKSLLMTSEERTPAVWLLARALAVKGTDGDGR